MIVLLHVIIALSSMAYTTLMYVAPSKNKLKISYGLIGLTLASGTYLVVSTHAQMLSSCMTGLIYLGIVSAGILAARHKLATQEQEHNL